MLMTLINDLLDFAKIENQKFRIKEAYFNLNDLIRKAFKTVEIQAINKNISLKYEKKIMLTVKSCQKANVDFLKLLAHQD